MGTSRAISCCISGRLLEFFTASPQENEGDLACWFQKGFFCFGSASLAARWLDYRVLQVGVPRNGSMHISGAAPTEVKENDEDNDADRAGRSGDIHKRRCCQKQLLQRGGVVRMVWKSNCLVWKSAGKLCFLFSTQKSCAQPCCKEYCSFSVAAV